MKRLVALLGLVWGASVFAHGAIPNAHQVTVRTGTPSELWLESTFGLTVSRDSGETWDWICDEALGFSSHAGLYIAPSGRVFAASFNGLFISDDGGCGWTESPLFADLSPSDVRASPSDPSRMFITTSRFMNVNGLFRSTDSGGSWTLSSLKSDTLFFSAVRLAPSNSQRVYVSAWWAATASIAKLFRSDDGGDTFTEIDLSAALPKGAFAVWAVHPTNPDILFASVIESTGAGATLLFRSENAGDTFAQVLTSDTELNGVSIAANGNDVFVGSDSGFFRSTDGGKTFEKLAAPTTKASPLISGADLYATGSQLKDGFALGKSTDNGATFTPLLQLSKIRGPLQCPAGTKTQVECPKYWPVVKASFPPSEETDGGVVETDGGSGEEPDPPVPPGCGCGAAAGTPLFMLTTLVLAVAARVSRRRT